MNIRDRIKEFKRVPASELLPNPKNWRKHPQAQADVLRGLLAEAGIADALLVRETDKGLMLIDGHLRAETMPDNEVPVLVLDVDEDDADKILATLDPLAAMAQVDISEYVDLVSDLTVASEDITGLMEAVANNNWHTLTPLEGRTDPEQEWQDMPEFVQEDQRPAFTLNVHFRNLEQKKAFGQLIGQELTEKTKSIWYPKAERDSLMQVTAHPDISRMVFRYNRWHHEVDYSVFKQQLRRRPGIEIPAGVNEYGMKGKQIHA